MASTLQVQSDYSLIYYSMLCYIGTWVFRGYWDVGFNPVNAEKASVFSIIIRFMIVFSSCI